MRYKKAAFLFVAVVALLLSSCAGGNSNPVSSGDNSEYNNGYKVGYDEGTSAGYDKGYADGYKIGYDEGGGIGYDNGYAAGQQAAYESTPSEQTPESGTEFVSAAPDAWSGDVGEHHVEIKGARLSKDRDGAPALIVTFAWTNNSGETKSSLLALMETAFQNGIEIDTAYSAEGYNSVRSKDVRPGATLEVEVAFKLTSETAPVEVEIKAAFSRDDTVVKATFNPAEL